MGKGEGEKDEREGWEERRKNWLLLNLVSSPQGSSCLAPDMANIVALLLINMFIFAVIGLSIFGDSCPRHFGTLGSSEIITRGILIHVCIILPCPHISHLGMFTLFVCVTQDGWMGIAEELQVQ